MLATLALLLLAFNSPSPQATNDPYAIYRAAMKHLATLKQPKYIIDTEHWVVLSTFGGESEPSEWDERRIFNSDTRRECVLNVPFTPKPPQIGESYFAPDSWLIEHQSTPAASSDGSQTLRPDLSDLHTIASVISVAKPSYDIRLVGIDALTHGGSAYHLSLRPRSNPTLRNLRELWVNTENDAIMRAVIEGFYRPNYHSMPSDTYVSEDFGQIGGYWLVIHHVWTYHEPMSSRNYQYDATSVTMQFPDALPDWLFDPKLFPAHYGEVTAIVGS
jgi:hypothetical protein